MKFCEFCASILDSGEQCICIGALSDRLLHYGEMLIDNNINVKGFYIRQRLIKYRAELYIHIMLNGEVLICQKIEEGEEDND